MKSLFKHLREMAKHKPRSIYKKSIQSRNYISSIGLILWASSCLSLPAYAEGSKDMFPDDAPGNRGSITWQGGTWGAGFQNRTLLRVFANKDEYILLGSSAVGEGSGNIKVYNPNTVTGGAAKENLPGTANLNCVNQQPGKGKIGSRSQELAGPQSVDGNGNTNGYVPCVYKAPSTGVYYIAMYGPGGENSSGGKNTNNNVEPAVDKINATGNQNSGISAWDVTVRDSESSTTDIKGRLFTFLINMNMGDNGRKLNSTLYPVTVDGYRYKVTMRGLDPFGFRIFGNQIGNLDSDGETPLYRDVLGEDGDINKPEGGTSTAPPQFPIFFNPPSEDALSAVTLYDREGKDVGNGIPLAPIPPKVTNPNFAGTSSGNTSRVNTGGTFTFDTNVPANYQIVISRDGEDFDPTNPQNRVLRGSIPIPGQQSVDWNGNDNSAEPFPVGNNYPYRVQIQSGEYHFPISDAENNVSGGPTIELLNSTNPLGNFTAFYDDRMYTTIGGTEVRGNQAYDPDKALCGNNPPNPPFSDPVNGKDSRLSTFRTFGKNDGGNTNKKCTGSFGDTKTLDTWIYVPSEAKQAQLNIIEPNVDVFGTLYEDSDGENDFDTNEPRLPKDITVTLYKDENDNNIIDDGEEVATTVTDDNGDYFFKDVADDDYKIKVDTTDSDIPDEYTLGTANDLEITVAGGAVTEQNFGFDRTVAANPIVLLVKRITAINGQSTNPNDGTPLNTLVNDTTSPRQDDDDNTNWPDDYLKGAINGGKVKPDDEIEYTVYFLSSGDTPARNVLLCDRVPANVTFIPNSFSRGLPGAAKGIMWLKDGSEQSLTNTKDGDAAQYFPPGIEPSSVYFDPDFPNKKVIDCGGDNTNGAVVVDLQDLPSATDPGEPNTSYGFIRFRGKVK